MRDVTHLQVSSHLPQSVQTRGSGNKKGSGRYPQVAENSMKFCGRAAGTILHHVLNDAVLGLCKWPHSEQAWFLHREEYLQWLECKLNSLAIRYNYFYYIPPFNIISIMQCKLLAE